MDITDPGPEPNAFDIETATKQNANYRTVVWSGKYLQVTLMSIPVGSWRSAWSPSRCRTRSARGRGR